MLGTAFIACRVQPSMDTNRGKDSYSLNLVWTPDSTSNQRKDAWHRRRKQIHFLGGGGELVGAAPLAGSGGMPPRKFLNFTHSEIVSRANLQELDDML